MQNWLKGAKFVIIQSNWSSDNSIKNRFGACRCINTKYIQTSLVIKYNIDLRLKMNSSSQWCNGKSLTWFYDSMTWLLAGDNVQLFFFCIICYKIPTGVWKLSSEYLTKMLDRPYVRWHSSNMEEFSGITLFKNQAQHWAIEVSSALQYCLICGKTWERRTIKQPCMTKQMKELEVLVRGKEEQGAVTYFKVEKW